MVFHISNTSEYSICSLQPKEMHLKIPVSAKMLQAVLHRTLAPPAGTKMPYGRSLMHWSLNRNRGLRNRQTEKSHTVWAAATTSPGCCASIAAGQEKNFKGKWHFWQMEYLDLFYPWNCQWQVILSKLCLTKVVMFFLCIYNVIFTI